MKIENEELVLSSGTRVPVDSGVIGLDAEGRITEGFTDQLLTHELTNHDKWELARYMIDRWMDYRDDMWQDHEVVMEGLSNMLDLDDVRERVEAETEKLHDEMMGGPGLAEMDPCLNILTANLIKASEPARAEMKKFGIALEVSACSNPNCSCQEQPNKPYITREHTAAVVLTSENIKESNKEEGLYMSDEEAAINLEAFTNLGDPPFMCRCSITPVIKESAQDYTCPVPECFYKKDGDCFYDHPSKCGIKKNYINGIEVDLNYKGAKP